MKYKNLFNEIDELHKNIVNQSLKSVNKHLIVRNWLIGHYLVRYEQNGSDRAEYGKKLLKKLAQDLTSSTGKGFSKRSLELFRRFFLIYPIAQTVSAQLTNKKNFSKNILDDLLSIKKKFSNITRDLNNSQYIQYLFSYLSWSHFVELLTLKDELKRSFYEIECIKNNWSVRELVRQKNSMLFERVGLSKNKEKILQMAQEGTIVETPDDLIKNPYVFEFLGLKEDAEYSESQLESALISHLQEFLFEMGKGFCFVARQHRISFNNDHYYIDLLLYNRVLKSLVLIDLKIRDFKPEDAGKMNFYLNYCKEHEMLKGEEEPIGIILCAGKDEVMVEYAFGSFENKIYATEYKLVLPSPEELKQEISNYKDHLVNIVQRKQLIESNSVADSSLDIYQEILTNFKGITKKRCSKLLDYFRKNDKIRMPNYIELYQISARSAHRDLAEFQNKGIIKFVGAKKNGHYELVKNYKELFQKLRIT